MLAGWLQGIKNMENIEVKTYKQIISDNKNLFICLGVGIVIGALISTAICFYLGIQYLSFDANTPQGQKIKVPISKGIEAGLTNDIFIACKLDNTLPICQSK